MRFDLLPNVCLAGWLCFFMFWGDALQAIADDDRA